MGPGETIWDKDLVGFGVRLQRRDPSFVVKYSFRGRQRFYTIGRHGNVTVDQRELRPSGFSGLLRAGPIPLRGLKTSSTLENH